MLDVRMRLIAVKVKVKLTASMAEFLENEKIWRRKFVIGMNGDGIKY